MATKSRSTRRKAPARARPKPSKKYPRRASRAHIERLTLDMINRAVIACGANQTRAARTLRISLRTLVRARKALLAQKIAEAGVAERQKNLCDRCGTGTLVDDGDHRDCANQSCLISTHPSGVCPNFITRHKMVELLAKHNLSVSLAAQEAGIDENYFHKLMREYVIPVAEPPQELRVAPPSASPSDAPADRSDLPPGNAGDGNPVV